MQSLWSDAESERLVEDYAGRGVPRDIALRVYTSRLLGGEPRLVLHGGGNTSVKTVVKDLLGEDAEVLCVKGSGWDMAAIEPAGLPAVRLAPLRKLRARPSLSDEEMVRVQRANLIDPGAPNPSVETLLHAFLPHKFVDHTHSTAVLSIADQPDAAERCAELYGNRMGLVPYIMPGFLLAKAAAEAFEEDPSIEGLVLLKHGIFTFGESAQQAYERMIDAVSAAEGRVARGRRTFVAAYLPDAVAGAADVAPILRGVCAMPSPDAPGAYKRFILDFRTGPAILDYVNGAELVRYAQAGVATPDHTIRTKNYPLLVPAPEVGRLKLFKDAASAAVARFADDYRAYFARHNARHALPKRELDPIPRVVLVPGLGLFGLGTSAKDARIAADIAESTIETVTGAESIGRFESIGESDLFDIEYWSLEQAKLGQGEIKPLQGQVALVTGGAGTIGLATARALVRSGTEIVLLDIDGAAAEAAAGRLGGA
ncbi:MAG TPA: bifunctional aldolase/short-chain dehydrogenase, partial [Stellaceae bacterium]|nr:bifunctional aldolase/short-chain dehydrogenase [Stellaceae bacterium]